MYILSKVQLNVESERPKIRMFSQVFFLFIYHIRMPKQRRNSVYIHFFFTEIQAGCRATPQNRNYERITITDTILKR